MWRHPESAAPPAETGQRLATFPRDRGATELRINLDRFEGHEYLSLRIWSRDRDGSFWPTKRGVSVRIHELADLVAALRRLERTLEARTPRQDRPAAGRGAHQPTGGRRATPQPKASTPDRDHQPLPGLRPEDEPAFNEFGEP